MDTYLKIWRYITIVVAVLGTFYFLIDTDLYGIAVSLAFGFASSLTAKNKNIKTDDTFLYGYTWGLMAWIWYLLEKGKTAK